MNSKQDKFKGTHTETYHHQTLKKPRQRENFEISKRDVTHDIQGILNKIISRFFIRNLGDQRQWADNIQNAKRKRKKKKPCHPKILYLAKLSSKSEGKIKTFPDEQKLREFITTRPDLKKC